MIFKKHWKKKALSTQKSSSQSGPSTQNKFEPLKEVEDVEDGKHDIFSSECLVLNEEIVNAETSSPQEDSGKVLEDWFQEREVITNTEESRDGEALVTIEDFSIMKKWSYVVVLKKDRRSSPPLT